MRKVMLLVIMIVIMMVFLTIPSGMKLDIEQLKQDVAEAPYCSKDYRSDVFDCSNMTMLLGQTLEKKGYSVVVVVDITQEGGGHAWLVVNGIVVECTSKRIVQQYHFKDYFRRETFLGTQSLWSYWMKNGGEAATVREWGTSVTKQIK